MSKIKTLPWKTQPKERTIPIGSDLTGVIEIPVKLGLTVNEFAYLNEKNKAFGLDNRGKHLITLSADIANKKNITFESAYQALASGDIAVLGEQIEELVNFQKESEELTRKELAIKSTVMLRRLDTGWEVEDTESEVMIGLQKLLAGLCDAEVEGVPFDLKQNALADPYVMTEEKAKKS